MILNKLDFGFIMKHFKKLSIFLIALLVVSCAPSNQTTRTSSTAGITGDQLDEVSEIASKMPAANQTEKEWLNGRLIEIGPPAIHSLIGMLKTPGTGDDSDARYAVNGFTKYVSRAGAESERSMYEQVLITELTDGHPNPVNIFLMEQLELVGSNDAIPTLRSFIGDNALHESATHTLRSINTVQAKDALLQGISQTDEEQQVVLIKALGDMQASSAQLVQAVSPFAESSNAKMKEVTLYALVNSGNPDAVTVVSQSGTAQHQLQLARRLAEEGYTEESTQIAQDVYSGDHPVHTRIVALNTLFKIQGDNSINLLLEASRDSNDELRWAALELAKDLEGAGVTTQFVNQLDQSSPAVQADIIEMLGQRGDTAAWSSLRPYLRDDNQNVRLAAATSAASLGGASAVSSLISALDRAEQPEEIETIKNALLRLPSQPMFQTASQRWMNLSSPAKVALIQILGQRQGSEYLDEVLEQLYSASGQVRLAMLRSLESLATPDDLPRIINLLSNARNDEERTIIQGAIASVSTDISESENQADPVLSALDEASDDEKPDLLTILPTIGGEKALQAVITATQSSNSDVQTAGNQALAKWQGPSAVDPLLQAFSDAPTSERQYLLDGLLRLIQETKFSDSTKVHFLSDAIDAAETNEEKTALIGALSEIQSPASLRAVSSYFDDDNQTVREESFWAAAQILAPAYDFSSDFDGADKVLAVLESTTDAQTKKKIENQITQLQSEQEAAEGFTSLFNGQDLTGWTGNKEAYTVRNGQIIHQAGESGNLFTEQEYSDFILRFQFKLTPGANNGLGIRSPLEGNPAYQAMELQILDNTAEKYSDLHPYQYHGSVYGVSPAERGHLKPVGEWNTQEVIANGSQITVKLNGVTILDTDIEEASSPETMDGKDHPGLLRSSGHIGFLGHGDEVAFRNIQIRDLNVFYPDYSTDSGTGGGMNYPPEGFSALFNGENLDEWKGLVENPEARAKMSEKELAEAQKEADMVMQEHWSVRDGILYFDGKGESLATEKDYKDFEMLVDWKIKPGGDSGVYLRGSPQVQIWDITENPVGSGGLYNNQQHLSDPLVPADNAIGEWNHMRIKMIGEHVSVHLNGQLVVPNVVLENYWNRDKPIYSEGQIELQAHNTPLYFKNVFIREIPRREPLFNGQDLTGWERVGGNAGSWNADDGLLYTEGDGEEWEKGSGGGWLSTKEMYDNFKLELEYRLPEGGNSGVFLRAPHEGDPAFQGIEIQLLDDYSDQYANLEPWQYTGSIYDVKAPSKRVSKKAGQWQKMEIVADGPELKVTLNGQLIINTSLVNFMNKVTEHPGLKRRKGYIGLQNHNSRVEFKNINITEIK